MNSDPFESNSQQIAPSGPDGRFGLQTQVSHFVGRQTLQEYDRDRRRDDTVAHTGNDGVHFNEVRDPSLLTLQFTR